MLRRLRRRSYLTRLPLRRVFNGHTRRPHASIRIAPPTPRFLNPQLSMSDDDREDTTIYEVVVNHEEQYSIWPADRELPLGWSTVGVKGVKPVCLDWIQKVWTDMRPKSLRDRMAADGQ
jgi:MbtH protein